MSLWRQLSRLRSTGQASLITFSRKNKVLWITARKARVAWLEQIKADELIDRNLWRSGLVPLPVWRRKVKKHVAKRKGNNPAPATDKKRKVDEASLEKSSP